MQVWYGVSQHHTQATRNGAVCVYIYIYYVLYISSELGICKGNTLKIWYIHLVEKNVNQCLEYGLVLKRPNLTWQDTVKCFPKEQWVKIPAICCMYCPRLLTISRFVLFHYNLNWMLFCFWQKIQMLLKLFQFVLSRWWENIWWNSPLLTTTQFSFIINCFAVWDWI